MAEQAAHLVDRVLPNVPVRQWVLTLPWEIRHLAAAVPEVLSAMSRIFVQCIFKPLQRDSGLAQAQCGAVTNIGIVAPLELEPHSRRLVDRSRYPIAVWHPQLGHRVEDLAGDSRLHPLPR